MTWAAVNFALQWGATPVGTPPPRWGHRPPTEVSLLYPPGSPAWAVVKGVLLFRGWTRTPTAGVSARKWVTLVTLARPGRWARRGNQAGLSVGVTSREVTHLVGRRYDYTRWPSRVRGTTRYAPAGAVTHAEGHLVRRRYV